VVSLRGLFHLASQNAGRLADKVVHIVNAVLAVSIISKCKYVPTYSHLCQCEHTVPLILAK